MKYNTETIWREFSHNLKLYISRRMSDPDAADDILQEVFFKIHSRIDTLKDNTKIRGWVYRITRNTIIDYYRKQKLDSDDVQEIDSIPVYDDEKPEKSPAQEVEDGLRGMVDALPDKYQQALDLVEFQGLSQTGLAKKLGISVSGAKSRVQRGRQMLKDCLMKCCHFQFDKYGTIIHIHPVTCCCCSRYSPN